MSDVCTKEELLVKLRRLEQQAQELLAKIERSVLDIVEYCDQLVKKVDSSSKRTMELLKVDAEDEDDLQVIRDYLRDEKHLLLEEIREYERKCEQKMEATRSKLVEHVEKVSEWAKRVLHASACSLVMSEANLPMLNDQIEKNLALFRDLFMQMQAFQLGGKQMVFIEGVVNGEEDDIDRLEILEMNLPAILVDKKKEEEEDTSAAGI
jgi:hypothetical protein